MCAIQRQRRRCNLYAVHKGVELYWNVRLAQKVCAHMVCQTHLDGLSAGLY